jgi:hypothetical protein
MAKRLNKPPGDYKVGYGRPPKGSQFQSGQSGNPKGRPKGQPTASEILMREAARVVRIQVGDKVETISKLEAVIRKLFQMAISGDARAMSMLLGATTQFAAGPHEGSQDQAGDMLSAALPDDDSLRRMLSRFDHLKSV